MMRLRSSGVGYTIVESMIFLAVSGALLLSIIGLINGQQRKTEFTTAVRDFDSKLQSVISNVANGYYNNPGGFRCTVNPGPPPTPTISAGSSEQGQNSDCTFVGQWINRASPNSFTITSYAGLRRTGSPPKEVQTLTDAQPTAITTTAETYDLPSGFTTSMKIISSGQIINTIAVAPTFNVHDASGVLQSGSSRSDVYAGNPASGPVPVNPSGGIQICLTDGHQFGAITLNGSTTIVKIGDGGICP